MNNRYEASEKYINECKTKHNGTYGIKSGRIYVVDDNVDINGEGYEGNLLSFSIKDNCYEDNSLIGTIVSKEITVELMDSNTFNLENKEIQPYMSVDDEEVPFGTFIISKSDNEEVSAKTSFTGYDYMVKFNVTYEDSNIYPISLYDFLKNVCKQVGVELGSESIVNGDYQIQGNPFTNNETCRQIVSEISQLCGGFAKIGRDDKLYIKNVNINQSNIETIDGYVYNDFTKNNQYGEVNRLVLSLSEDITGEHNTIQDVESIEKNGLTQIVISANSFLTQAEERLAVIDNIWDVVHGFQYIPFTIDDYYGFPYLDSGDKVIVLDNDDNEHETYIFNHTITYNGVFSGSIETGALTETQQTYSTETSAKSKIRNVELSVDKINGQITSIIEEQDEFSSGLSSVTQTVDELSQKISSITDFTREVTSLNQIYLSDIAEGLGYVLSLIIYVNTNVFNTNEITIVASTQPRGYGENITIDTEDGEAILTEDGIELFVGARGYVLDYITLTLDGILNSVTIGDTTYYDTVEISQDGTITQTRIIGDHYATTSCDIYGGTTNVSLTTENSEDLTTEDGDTILNEYEGEDEVVGRLTEGTYVFVYEVQGDRARIGEGQWVDTIYLTNGYGLLDEEIITVLEETFVIPSKEEVYFFIEELAGISYYCKYIIKNDYTDLFATKVELNTAITQTETEIRFEVSKKVDEDEICSVISQSAEQIYISGNRLVIDSTNFKLDENGNVTLIGTIYDDNGEILVAKDRILTDLTFTSEYASLGCYLDEYGTYGVAYLKIPVQIPENFEIKEAYVTVRHNPIKWSGSETGDVVGNARYIQVYYKRHYALEQVDNNSDYYDYIKMSEFATPTDAFGSEGYTFSNSETESVTSDNISEYLTNNEITEIFIGTQEPDLFSFDHTDYTNARRGTAQAQIHVIGYYLVK